MNAYSQRYEDYVRLIEQGLNNSMNILAGENISYDKPLVDAMRYSLLSGGKRLRPVLLLGAYATFRGDVETALPFAAGIEMIHTYSLIHDDLPCMDDDALRRGKPTNHIVFGEAMALLAGDALLNLAFEVMSACVHPYTLRVVNAIASRSGCRGMIAGQTADMVLSHQVPDKNKARYIHLHKTADLITAAVQGGLLLSGAPQKTLDAGERYGRHLGVAFQIVDDLLDLRGDVRKLGKEVHKDQMSGKITWPALAGEAQSEADAETEINLAVQAAEEIEGPAGFLGELARHTLKRVQ
ncbi:MAG: polyprenyl synthetase family protein [Eubacteriales bacterium]|jgi:geranylgeranyl diphosphate synthase type II|nr:polyprenyl synthetase family protein [Eubacteriales bacterium]MDD4134917.1 polyprenyl synthetase family protein [Eubacteriales bacterium]NLO13912.1 polyprenyl synthetase family protein [Clostridiales bacterium]